MDIKGCQIYSQSQEEPDLYWSGTGYATKFGKSSWKIVKGAMVVAHGTKSRTLYTIAGYMNKAAVAEVFQIEVYGTIDLDI